MTVFEKKTTKKKNRAVTLWVPFGITFIQPENDLCERACAQMRQQKTPAGEIPVFRAGLARSSTGTQVCQRRTNMEKTKLFEIQAL